MKTVNIENDLHQRVKIAAAERGWTVEKVVHLALENELRKKFTRKKSKPLASAFGGDS